MPQAVAFPRSAAQASSIIGAAADANIPITPRDAGSGLAGGAIGDGLPEVRLKHMAELLADALV